MTLRSHQLYAKLSKCEFWLKEVIFLGYIISVEGISEDLRKDETLLKLGGPKNMTKIYSFLKLAGYYQRFIERFSTIAIPMTRLTQEEIKWE
jgi:hypothetical protein